MKPRRILDLPERRKFCRSFLMKRINWIRSWTMKLRIESEIWKRLMIVSHMNSSNKRKWCRNSTKKRLRSSIMLQTTLRRKWTIDLNIRTRLSTIWATSYIHSKTLSKLLEARHKYINVDVLYQFLFVHLLYKFPSIITYFQINPSLISSFFDFIQISSQSPKQVKNFKNQLTGIS